MIKKNILLVLLAFALFQPVSKADEGMWLPFMIPNMLFDEMSGMGLNLTPEEMFSFTETSLKDAIVSFGGFCTGEIISDNGLVLTNHHCGYGRIQSHSSLENDYLNDGFWAMSLEEELPNPGLYVRFLVSVEDVTNRVLDDIKASMPEDERSEAISERVREITSAATEDNHYRAQVRAMFAGNEYYLFIYEDYTDIRMVGTPPNSIGKYGGDTDNWMWPRHTGDFMLFRVYTCPEGKPADYSEENIPLKPKHHLPMSLKGVQADDFAMIYGYPGGTQRYLTSHGIEFNLDMMYPIRIDIRRKKLDIIEEAMLQSDEVRIKYSSKHARIANFWKNFIGMSEALQKHKVADTKRELEQEFTEWVNSSRKLRKEYGETMSLFEKAYEGARSVNSYMDIHVEALITGPEIYRIALNSQNLYDVMEEEPEENEKIIAQATRLKSTAENIFKNLDLDVDRKLWAAMLKMYYENVSENLRADIFNEILKEFADFENFANHVYENSIFADLDKLNEFAEEPDIDVLKNDWVFRFADETTATRSEVSEILQEYYRILDRANRQFIRGLREMKPDYLFYPDANSTMRFTYGSVNGYYPADAVFYDYVTTLDGVMEKEDPDHHEFVVPEKLKELWKNKDYGDYGVDGTMYVNFVSNNDITGGNSGSPVINGDGHLIGLAFDGNWEAMSGDILFEPEVQRTISVDARYILFIIDKFAGAGYLLEEMTIIK